MKKQNFYLSCLLLFFLINVSSAQYTQNDWLDRDEWMHVADLFKLAELGADYKVADVGCHEGYLSIHLSEIVGKLGKVYAVDINDERLIKLKKTIKRKKIENIEVILGDTDDPKLPVGELDIVFVIDTYHEVSAYTSMLAQIKKALKPGGRIVVLEKIKAHMTGKMREQQANAHTLSLDYVEKELKVAGFNIIRAVKHFGYWERDLNKVMWVLVAEKS